MKLVFRCPKCGGGEKFDISVYGDMTVDKYGSRTELDVAPSGRDAITVCHDCKYVGRLKDFHKPLYEEEPDQD